MTNSWRPGVGLNVAIASRLMDHYLGLPSRDYAAEFRTSWRRNASADEDQEAKLAAARIKNTAPTLPLAACVGLYRDQLGLDVEIVLDGDQLRLRYAGGQLGNLTHWHRDTFRLTWDSPFSEGRPTFVDFDIDEYGKVSRLRMELMHDRIDASMIEPRR
jgi:hypothetical protein